MSDAGGALVSKAQLSDKLWKTAGSRFLAARRLRLTAKCHTICIISTSIIVLCISILSFAGKVPPTSKDVAEGLSIVASIGLLVFGALNPHLQVGSRASELYRSAKAINRLKADLTPINPDDRDQLLASSNKYEDHIAQTDENHDQVDFMVFAWQNRGEFQKSGHAPQVPAIATIILSVIFHWLAWPLVSALCVVGTIAVPVHFLLR